MRISQLTILSYLKGKSVSISKSSDDDENDAFLYLTGKGLMKELKSGYATITMSGMAFLHNSYYFDPVPENIYDWKLALIDRIKEGEAEINGQGDLFNNAIVELKQDGIVEPGTYSTYLRLTTKGRMFLGSGKSYQDFLQSQTFMNPNIVYNMNGGNSKVYNHSQDYSQSYLGQSNDNLFRSLREVISNNVDENQELLNLVENLYKSKGNVNYLTNYIKFISIASNHIRIISVFIPELTKLIIDPNTDTYN